VKRQRGSLEAESLSRSGERRSTSTQVGERPSDETALTVEARRQAEPVGYCGVEAVGRGGLRRGVHRVYILMSDDIDVKRHGDANRRSARWPCNEWFRSDVIPQPGWRS